jgi:hypothetical protein
MCAQRTANSRNGAHSGEPPEQGFAINHMHSLYS